MCSARLKNNRAEEMIILLLDANKTVNSIITVVFFQSPCEQQPKPIHPLQSTHYLGGAFPWMVSHQGLGVSEERVCIFVQPRIKVVGC